MICPFCNKNEATIHFTEVINGKMEETHMCEECAMKKGIETNLPFSFGDILSAITKGIENLSQFESEEFLENPKCPSCGLTIKDFIKKGKLGCPECYHAFDDALKNIIKNVQKSPNHTGKIPKIFPRSEDAKRRIEELEKNLNKAVGEERYEDCVTLRDEIKRLKQAAENTQNV
ncbi:MAG: hypothetical protein DRI44_01645 [Chlamydiae bacterium]|nr:MAG: hypothetical protein DRI44_01645 [Chlamydiota bacterium]